MEELSIGERCPGESFEPIAIVCKKNQIVDYNLLNVSSGTV
jgi:hypothetical protein